MFFKTKQKRSFLNENPRDPRYTCIARVNINGFEGEAVLRNINHGGFCMESRTYAALMMNEYYLFRIKPEASAAMSAFELTVETRWVKSTETNFNAGFLISQYPSDGSFDRYVEYIKSLQ
jgi:hypothetical protein